MRISSPKKKWNIKLLLKDGIIDEEIEIGQVWECADYVMFTPKMLWQWCQTIIDDRREDVLDRIKCHYEMCLRRREGVESRLYFSLSAAGQVF